MDKLTFQRKKYLLSCYYFLGLKLGAMIMFYLFSKKQYTNSVAMDNLKKKIKKTLSNIC